MTRKRYYKLLCALSTEVNNTLLDGCRKKYSIAYQIDRHIDFKQASQYGITSYQEAWDNVMKTMKTILPKERAK